MVVAEGALLAAGPPPTTRSDAGPTAERPAAPTAAPGPPPTPTAAPGPTAPTSTATPPIWWNAGDLSPRRRASPLLRVIGLASIGIGVPAALGRIVDLTYGVMHESWLTLPMLAPNIAVAVMDLVVAVVAGIMLQGSGRLPWIGGGLLIGRAIINLRTVPQSLDLWQVGGYLGAWGSIRVGILQALVFAVLAALNVLALRRIRPAPACPRSSPRLAAGITVLTAFGSISYVVAYFAVLGDPPWETAFQWTWLAGTGTAMVAYAMFGRPVAVAPGLLVAAATSVAPFIVLLIAGTGPADQTGLRVGGSILVMTYLATLPLAVAVLRSRGERAVAR
jgi:hypothetical protein